MSKEHAYILNNVWHYFFFAVVFSAFHVVLRFLALPLVYRMTFIRMASYRMNRDGLTTAKYIVMSRHATPLYTKVVVDIGHNHKWHFANPQKLIVNL